LALLLSGGSGGFERPPGNSRAQRTTGLWPQACREMIGMEWLAPLPPEYLWTFGSKLPAGVRYMPDRNAIGLVIAVLRLQGRDYS
jgi:hypothetical protein